MNMDIKAIESRLMELEKRVENGSIEAEKEMLLLLEKLKRMKKTAYKGITPWDKVQIARSNTRPIASEYIKRIFDRFIEFHGDRLFKDDPAIVGGVAFLGSIPVTVIAQQKGTNLKENIYRNFGMPNPDGYRKALRLMKQAEKFKRPIITFVDTPGAYCGIQAEERGQGEAIARNLFEMSGITVPIISIVIGEGGSGGALAVSIADEIWMLENSIYSILSPEGFASILYKDAKRAQEASEIMKLTAQDLKELKVVDKIIKEPYDLASSNMEELTEKLKTLLSETISSYSKMDKEILLKKRYDKFRDIGDYETEKKLHEIKNNLG